MFLRQSLHAMSQACANVRWGPHPGTYVGGHVPSGGSARPSPHASGPQKNPRGGGAPVGTGATTDASSWNDAISSASHVSISLNVVQRWNGQPASIQIRSSERFANTTSE